MNSVICCLKEAALTEAEKDRVLSALVRGVNAEEIENKLRRLDEVRSRRDESFRERTETQSHWINAPDGCRQHWLLALRRVQEEYDQCSLLLENGKRELLRLCSSSCLVEAVA